MSQLTMEGIYHNGVVIPREDVPYDADMRVLITFIKEIPKEDIYAHIPEIQEALAKAEINYEEGNFKEYADADALFKDLNNDKWWSNLKTGNSQSL